jgi:crotonobetainyl-CoA:carnitine CoA-transferase CaiB-like acyl-CoA transferase
MAVLESKLIIGASDETGAAFASVMARIIELSAKLASVNGALGGALPRAVAIPSSLPSRVASIPSLAPLRAAPPASGFWETAGAAIATMTGAKAVMGGYHEAMEQQHERMRQELAAMSADEIAKGEKLSAELAAKYPSIPQSEVMHSLRTARTVTGSFDEATDVLEPLTKLRVIAQAASPGTSAEDMRGEFDKLVKALEVAGVTQDKPRLNSYINDVAKIAQRLRGSDQARRLF